MTVVPLLFMIACDHRPFDGQATAAPSILRLAKALADANLCVTNVIPSGRIGEDDELASGAPLCGDGCRTPTPLTTAEQRRAIYTSVLLPRAEALRGILPVCGQSPHGTNVSVVLGFVTVASESHVGRASVRVVASKPYRKCSSEVVVASDPSESLDHALDTVATDLGGCITRNWQPVGSP